MALADLREDSIYVHLVWFHDRHGHWLAEWAGYVPEPSGGSFDNEWLHHVQADISPDLTIAAEIDADAWDACKAGGAVCLEVSKFAWPVGDQRYHRWNRLHRMIDWPDVSVHKYIEVDTQKRNIIANQSSHRPIRDAVINQRILDITGTPLARLHGSLWGSFLWTGDRWRFVPRDPDGRLITEAQHRLLTEASSEMDLCPSLPITEGVITL